MNIKTTPAEKVDNLLFAPDLTLITDCPIMAQPPIPPNNVLIFMIIVLGGLVVQIPMPILAGIMVMVSIGTFEIITVSIITTASVFGAF
jgi:hypothetical protein